MNRYLLKSIYSHLMVISIIIAVLTVGHAHASETETETAYTPEDCIECHRTGSEESGLHISIERQLNRTFTDEGHFEIIFFVGSLKSRVNFEPCEPFKWLSCTELDLCTFPAANRSVVNWLRDSLSTIQGGS